MINKCSKCNKRLGTRFITVSRNTGEQICADCAYKEALEEAEKTFGIGKDKKHGN